MSYENFPTATNSVSCRRKMRFTVFSHTKLLKGVLLFKTTLMFYNNIDAFHNNSYEYLSG